MSPAYPETITSLEDLQFAEEQAPGLFTIAEEEPKKPERKLSNEAKNKVEAEQAEGLKVFIHIPQEIEDTFGNMVLEIVAPETQLDPEVVSALARGKKIKSNVTGEMLTAAEMRDHWILPRGEQISKSTGAIYLPEESTKNHDMRNSFLFWEYGNFKKLLDSKDPVAPKVGIDTEQGHLSEFEKAYLDVGSTEKDLEHRESGEGDGIRVSKTTGSLKLDNKEVLYAKITEPYIPRHPESDPTTYKITKSETDSTLPPTLEGEGMSIAEKMWGQVGPFFPDADAARHSSEALIAKYPPVLISRDLIILRAKNPETFFKYIAFAKVDENSKGGRWEEKLVKEDDAPADLTQWLAGLEKRSGGGKHLRGYHSAALSPA